MSNYMCPNEGKKFNFLTIKESILFKQSMKLLKDPEQLIKYSNNWL